MKLEEAGHVVHLEADPEAEGGGEGGPLLQGLLDRGGLALHEPCVVDVTAGLVEGAVLVVDDQVGAGDRVEKLTADREDSAACKKKGFGELFQEPFRKQNKTKTKQTSKTRFYKLPAARFSLSNLNFFKA